MPIPPEVAKENLEQALSFIAARYSKGVDYAEWKKPTLAAKENYYAALQVVISERLWEKGVEKSDDETWRKGCKENAAKLAAHLREALDIWYENWKPKYENVLRIRETLPPKTLDPYTNIDNRLKPIVAAWRGERAPGT